MFFKKTVFFRLLVPFLGSWVVMTIVTLGTVAFLYNQLDEHNHRQSVILRLDQVSARLKDLAFILMHSIKTSNDEIDRRHLQENLKSKGFDPSYVQVFYDLGSIRQRYGETYYQGFMNRIKKDDKGIFLWTSSDSTIGDESGVLLTAFFRKNMHVFVSTYLLSKKNQLYVDSDLDSFDQDVFILFKPSKRDALGEELRPVMTSDKSLYDETLLNYVDAHILSLNRIFVPYKQSILVLEPVEVASNYWVGVSSKRHLFVRTFIQWMTILALLMAVVVLLFLMLYVTVAQKIISSLDVIASISKKVAEGALDERIYLEKSEDEVYEFSKNFNMMIDKLRAYSRKLIYEKERSEAIFSCIPDSVIVTDIDAKIVLLNEESSSIFGIPKDKSEIFLLDYIKHPIIVDLYKNASSIDGMIIKEVVLYNHRVGRDIHYQLNWIMVEGVDDEPTKSIMTFRDITYEKQVDGLKDVFIRMVSHELRTPLTSVIGFIELVLISKNFNVEEKQCLAKALEEARSLSAKINEVIEFSQVYSGRMKMIFSKIRVVAFINQIEAQIRESIVSAGLEVRIKCPDDTLYVVADAKKLERILLNLVSNAIKSTKEGYIELGCIPNDKEIIFYVKDTGRGLSEEEQFSIFDKFRRVDIDLDKETDGLGLGLAIVKQLVDMHGAKIIVDSAKGEGTMFKIIFSKDITNFERGDRDTVVFTDIS